MAADPNALADTNMMRIVHTALLRDLERARSVLSVSPPPGDHQFVALARHLKWMMSFLEAHHRSEDLGLYPVVRERDRGSTAVLADMAADHSTIAVAIADVDAATSHVAERDHARALAAVDALLDVLRPHLRREEDEVMPIVARVMTRAEWDAIEQAHNIAGKSLVELGREGHWLIDAATPQDRARVLGLVPLAQRAVLLHGFGPLYRRQARACWWPRRRGVQHEGSTAVVVDADIDAVWDVVRDPTRVGEWSHECIDGEWVGDATAALPGARFRGRNRQGLIRWGRLCEVVEADPYRLVWRTVPTKLYPDSTEWALRLERADDGTRVEQTFRVVRGTKLEPLYAAVLPAHRDRTTALTHDLERIGALAARS